MASEVMVSRPTTTTRISTNKTPRRSGPSGSTKGEIQMLALHVWKFVKVSKDDADHVSAAR